MPAEPLLQADGLTVRVRGQSVVENLSFALAPGERLALLGPSGAGKSMTAGALLGLTTPATRVEGSIRINGVEVAALPATRRPVNARVGMVFQNTQAALNPLVSVASQLGTPFMRFHGLSRRAALNAATELLARMMIVAPDQILRRSPAQLSGGQRQRVCMALALACRPSLIVADEATSALDSLTRMEMIELLESSTGTAQTPALLFISHDITAAARLCRRAVVIDGGRKVEDGTLREMIASPCHPFMQALAAALEEDELNATPWHGRETHHVAQQ